MAFPTKLAFTTHAELKNVIGQDLINDDNIAVVELVKNGVDAGAKKVSLFFHEPGNTGGDLEGPMIIVQDDGAGMSEADVVTKWLNIAYSEKKANPHSGDRVLAGNKGVGRFACDRLGAKLDMFTRRRGGPVLHVEVDWSAFENKTEITDTIQKIRVKGRALSSASEVTQLTGRAMTTRGTMLVITGLRRQWTREKLLHLKRTLQKFLNPMAVFDHGYVGLELFAPHELTSDEGEEPEARVNGEIQNQVFERLKFKTTYLDAKLSDDGKLLTTELHHEGKRVYRLVEKTKDFKPLSNISLVIHYMNPYKKAYFKRQTGLNVVDFGSVFLFINGYRVPPYGDRDDDWLKLDNRKAQGTNRFLGKRELLGLINVVDPDRNFRIVSNREGIVRDDSFTALTKRDGGLFYTALTRLERFVVDGLNWDSVPEHVRRRLQAGEVPGERDMPSQEVYDESADLKTRRVALDVLRIVGASPVTTEELEIDPEILETLSREREDDVKGMLEKFGTFESEAIGHDVKLALGRIQQEFERQKQDLKAVRQEASRKGRQVERLKTVARGIAEQRVYLERQVKTQQSEVLFSRVSSSADRDQLLLLHHQAGLYAQTAQNFLEKALKQIRLGDVGKASEWISKALNSTNKAVKVSNFATKANFRLKTGVLTEDIVRFIREYVLNVAKDGSAQNLRVSISGDSGVEFITRFKPIDLAVVIDNIASNSSKFGAGHLNFKISSPAENELRIEILDDGLGLPVEIQPPEAIFERGVTTTNGSGLGLFHVRETIKDLGGTIQLQEGEEAGFGLLIRLFK